MKKLKVLLVLALVLFIPFMVNVQADETKEKDKINVYLFRGEGCPHCAEAEEWFDTLKDDEEYSKYYILVDYEVWYDEDNAKLMDKVAEKLGTEANGVPFLVIGDKYYSGFAESMVDQIKTSIKEAYENEEYVDVVKGVKEGTYKTKTEEKQSSALVPIIIVSIIAVVTVVALIFFTKEK